MKGASRELATRLRGLRSLAISGGRSVGLVFERDAAGWRYRLYQDGDGDGIRSADVVAGVDVPLEAPQRLSDRWPGLDFGCLGLPRVRRLPPSAGWMDPPADPIQFGSAHIVSFSPRGESSSGTLYVCDHRSQMTAIILFGPTVRVRMLRYDMVLEEWSS